MIHILGLVLVCAALITITYFSPKIGFGLLGGIVVLVAVLYFANFEDASNPGFEVPPELVKLEDVSARPSYGDSWDYSGRVTNDSNEPIYDIQISLKMYDCQSDSPSSLDECTLIGDQIDFVTLKIPPRQARDFTDNISFRDARPQGSVNWSFELVGVRVVD